jgi:hypothetical protein
MVSGGAVRTPRPTFSKLIVSGGAVRTPRPTFSKNGALPGNLDILSKKGLPSRF